MKWNMVIGALVLSIGLCGQSFGAGLLNKMLGCGGCGSSCCDSAPACGCEAAPSCGCAAAPACGCAPSCGGGLLGSGNLLGNPPCCANPCCNLLKFDFACLNRGCGSGCAAPSCGCDTGCDAGCDSAAGCDAAPSCGCGCRGGLLSGIRKCGTCCPILKLNMPNLGICGGGWATSCDTGCAAGGGDFDGPASDQADPEQNAPANELEDAPDASDAAPMPPAPIVDPSAFVPSKRRIMATNAGGPR